MNSEMIDYPFIVTMKKNNILVEEENIEVSLTPLIDTVLVLLIVFILASPSLEQILKIYVPAANSYHCVSKENYFCIAINQHGKIFLKNKEEINIKNLIMKLKEYKKSVEKPMVLLFADKDLLLYQITDIINSMYEIGIENVCIKTKKINF